jgi:hapalindole H/12-epi-hapalindole U/12-epi-fischerindole U synthase
MEARMKVSACTAAVVTTLLCGSVQAVVIPVVNPGFENITGQFVYNEFTFGTPVGWQVHDPFGIVAQPDIYVGTLRPNGVQFFPTLAPEGQRVAILFNSGREGLGEYGFRQTLTAPLLTNTTYHLSVRVGNIASGTAVDGVFYNLDHFPGYRVDLLAGNTVIASDNNSLQLAEGQWGVSVVSLAVSDGAGLPIGQMLGVRIVSLNQIPAGFTAQTSPDLEVDFDEVRLFRTIAIPEPGVMLSAGAMIPLALRRRR